jgi:hypothetical protein
MIEQSVLSCQISFSLIIHNAFKVEVSDWCISFSDLAVFIDVTGCHV